MVLLGNIFQRNFAAISVACWMKKPGTAGWQSIVERSNWDNPDGIGLWADWHGTGVSFGHYLSGYAQSTATVQDDRWHHVVGTMTPGGPVYEYRIYVDGKLDNMTTNSVGMVVTSHPWTIGARYDGSWYYQGLVEEVRMFNHALSAAEVEKLYRE